MLYEKSPVKGSTILSAPTGLNAVISGCEGPPLSSFIPAAGISLVAFADFAGLLGPASIRGAWATLANCTGVLPEPKLTAGALCMVA